MGRRAAYEWPEREHGIHVDHKGFVWVGGNNCPARALTGLKPIGDDQLVKFAPDGKFVMQIGRSTQSGGNADTKNLHQPADVWVHPPTNELFVADGYGNHRVAVFDADTGAFKRMWGAFGNPPRDDDKCPPPSLTSVPPGDRAGSVQHRARHPRLARRDRVRGGPREPAGPDVHARRQVHQAGHAPRVHRSRAISRCRRTPSSSSCTSAAAPTSSWSTASRSRSWDRSQARASSAAATRSAPIQKGNIYVAAIARGVQKLVFKGIAAPAVR